MADFSSLAAGAASEMGAALARINPAEAERLCHAIEEARAIVLYGCGREGLMMRAFCMRLFHLGLNVHMQGDMTTPPVGESDLFLASVGPGELSTVSALLNMAKTAGAATLAITAQPNGATSRLADGQIILPAQTMADDTRQSASSALPMGSLFEIVQLVFFDLVAVMLRDRLGQSATEMRARHTNLE